MGVSPKWVSPARSWPLFLLGNASYSFGLYQLNWVGLSLLNAHDDDALSLLYRS